MAGITVSTIFILLDVFQINLVIWFPHHNSFLHLFQKRLFGISGRFLWAGCPSC